MITDDVFRAELDASLKAQKIKKPQRNKTIGEYLLLEPSRRDSILDGAAIAARTFQENKKKAMHIPLERDEQANVVDWFRRAHPSMVIMLINNDDDRDQTHNIVMGLHKGAADLYITDMHLWVEMKRQKPKAAPWSADQQEFKRHVESHGDTYILCFGSEDAKSNISAIITKNENTKSSVDNEQHY